jgi:hypothetical protein
MARVETRDMSKLARSGRHREVGKRYRRWIASSRGAVARHSEDALGEFRDVLVERKVKRQRERLDPDEVRPILHRLLALVERAEQINLDPALTPGLAAIAYIVSDLQLLAEDARAVRGVQAGLLALHSIYAEADPGSEAVVTARRKILRARHRKALDAVLRIRGDQDYAAMVDAWLPRDLRRRH